MEKLVLLVILSCTCMTSRSYPVNDSASALRFAVIGDWGGIPLPPYYTKQQKLVAAELANTVSQWGADFIVSVGDNFYYQGVRNVEDHRFKTTFENVFNAKSLQHVPWYVVAGNHDHKGNVSAQIAYTNVSSRWKFPALYYDMSFKIPNSNVSVKFLMLDTVIMCGNSDDFLGGQPLEAADPVMAARERSWLEDKLKSSKEDYLIVVGHYPVFSIAEHGPTKCLQEYFEHLFQKYKVTAYLCGHDHNMQYIQDRGSTGHVLSGAGNFQENSRMHQKDVPKKYLRFYQADMNPPGSFVYIQIKPKEMTITYIQSGGKSLYQTTLRPRSL